VIGLGAAIERMQDIGMTAVERHDLALRNRAYEQLTQIRKLRILSSPPGPSATAIVACVLPDNIDSMTLRDALLAKYGIIVKMSEKRHFNGFRLSPHILNSEAHVDAALKALRAEVG
jgi:selenocysteine lyase/cysteine desulfurase